MRKHLAIFSIQSIEKILSGKRKFEVRFSIKRIPPFGQISVGDLVYLKPSGKEVVGQFKVKKVVFLEGVEESDLDFVKLKLDSDTKNYFKKHLNAKYGTIIFIGSVEEFITSPIKIKKSDQRGWMVLN